MSKARALYDFVGDSSMNELSFKTGDEITVLRKVIVFLQHDFTPQDIGEGWWEGQIHGVVGLFPQTYVELSNENAGDSDDWDEEEGDEEWDESEKPQASHAPEAGGVSHI